MHNFWKRIHRPPTGTFAAHAPQAFSLRSHLIVHPASPSIVPACLTFFFLESFTNTLLGEFKNRAPPIGKDTVISRQDLSNFCDSSSLEIIAHKCFATALPSHLTLLCSSLVVFFPEFLIGFDGHSLLGVQKNSFHPIAQPSVTDHCSSTECFFFSNVLQTSG